MSTATSKMRAFNSSALITQESGYDVMIEDVWDSPKDKRMYRLEYRATSDARRALAIILSNPWDRARRNAGKPYGQCHVSDNGIICIGSKQTNDLASSPYDLDFVLKRARFFCTAFSAWMESGCSRSLNEIAAGR